MPEWLSAVLLVAAVTAFYVGKEWWDSHHKNRRWRH